MDCFAGCKMETEVAASSIAIDILQAEVDLHLGPQENIIETVVETLEDNLIETTETLEDAEAAPDDEVRDEGETSITQELSDGFKIIQSQRNRRKLMDGEGFTYTLKKESENKVFWRCSVRNKNMCCRATVIQNGDSFKKGNHAHLHGLEVAKRSSGKKISFGKLGLTKVKRESTKNILTFQPQATDGQALYDGQTDETEQGGGYTIIRSSSQRLHPKLIDDAGYTYTMKSKGSEKTQWRCSVRNKTTYCRATVIQQGKNFKKGAFVHIHPGNPGRHMVEKIIAQVKTNAKLKPFQPASNIVNEVLTANVGNRTLPGMPHPTNLARAANRMRQRVKGKGLDFQDGLVPEDFVKRVVNRGKKCHFLLATNNQLQILSHMTQWYIDVNTKIVNSPFKLLLSVHGFVKKNHQAKVVPLFFALMSGKKRKDFTTVFNALKELIPDGIRVTECMLDYDTNLWRGLNDAIPNLECVGSAYHWIQTIWGNIKAFGLHLSYLEDPKVFKLMRKLMALPFIPAELVPEMLTKLQQKATTGLVHQLLNYVEATWVEGDKCLWSPSSWSVYMQPYRTCNDLHNWHDRLSKIGKKGRLPLSALVLQLYGEAKVALQVMIIYDGVQKRPQEESNKAVQNKTSRYWDDYQQQRKSLKHLLKACAATVVDEGYVEN
ncbi:uncharacterized protein [Asterias amurensis]|uniref:uncharacterized protein n=1 Tax=Asterias amurensis TaxID=7602 RepID=UPI003AB4DCCD